MTTPTALAPGAMPLPVASTPPNARDAGGDAGSGSGQGSAEEFASMVAGMVAALLNAAPAAEPGTDASGTAPTSEPAEGPGAQQAGDAPAPPGLAANLDRMPDAARAPQVLAALATGQSPAEPHPLDSGRAAGPSRSGDTPAPQAESAIPATPAAPGTSAAPGTPGAGATPATPAAPHVDGPGRAAETARGAGAPQQLDGPHSGGAPGPSKPADAPATRPESQTTQAPQAPSPTQTLLAPAPVTPVDAPAAPAAAAPAPAATAAQLVAPVVAVHRRGPEGTHMLTVEITPDELGPVRISVELRDGNVELQLAGHSEAARDALRAALPELRRALEAAGVGTGTFAVAPDAGGQPQNGTNQQPQTSGDHPQNGHARPAWAGPEGPAQHRTEPEPTPVARTGGSSLDLQL